MNDSQTETPTLQQAQQQLKGLRQDMREVRAQLSEHQTRIDDAGLDGELDPLDLAAADELSDRLDTLHTQIMQLQFSPVLQGDAAPQTPEQIATERRFARQAKRDNARARRSAAVRLAAG